MVCKCGIKKSPYNYKEKEDRIDYRCINCRLDKMIDTTRKICIVKQCLTRANYGTNKPEYCADHKQIGTESLVTKKCESGCGTIATYGIDKVSHCKKCKTPEMQDLKHAKCKTCGIRACYGYDKPEYCVSHKEKAMKILHSRLCKYHGCESQRNFGFDKTEFCSMHKQEGMKNLLYTKCMHEACELHATYGIDKAEYCLEHKTDEMKDLKHTMCKNKPCDIRASKKYKGYCFTCFFEKFPNEERVIYYKIKQNLVCNFISENFSSYSMIFDKKCGSSQRRPDILFKFEKYCIIIEIDENQHCKYKDEKERIKDLENDLKLPIIFIRFNPDSYKTKVKKIKCPFNSKCEIIHPKHWSSRLKKLKKTLGYYLKNPIDITQEIKLFYDEI